MRFCSPPVRKVISALAIGVVHEAERELIEFLLRQPTLAEIADFQLSEEASDRFYELVDASRERALTSYEREELDVCVYLEHLVRMLKAEAHRRLAAERTTVLLSKGGVA